MVLWCNALTAFSSNSDNVGNTELCTLKLGGSRVLQLKNKKIYIIRHSGSDPKLFQWFNATAVSGINKQTYSYCQLRACWVSALQQHPAEDSSSCPVAVAPLAELQVENHPYLLE